MQFGSPHKPPLYGVTGGALRWCRACGMVAHGGGAFALIASASSAQPIVQRLRPPPPRVPLPRLMALITSSRSGFVAASPARRSRSSSPSSSARRSTVSPKARSWPRKSRPPPRRRATGEPGSDRCGRAHAVLGLGAVCPGDQASDARDDLRLSGACSRKARRADQILLTAAAAPSLQAYLVSTANVNPIYAQLRDAGWAEAQASGNLDARSAVARQPRSRAFASGERPLPAGRCRVRRC